MRNPSTYEKIKQNWDSILKPLDAMGQFEEISSKIGAILNDQSINIERAALVIFCADNGIVREGVSQSDESVTANVVELMGKNKSSVCQMAGCVGVDVFPVDLGLVDRSDRPGVDSSFFISPGTNNFSEKPAMTREQCDLAIEAGRAYVKKLVEAGYKAILLGEMGIGNTTTSAAIIASILDIEISQVCGRGSGLSDQGLSKKIEVIERAIKGYRLKERDVIDVLSNVGGYDIAAMVGAILEASTLSVPIILDGVITAAAALIACKLDTSCQDVLIFSHKGRENGIMLVADYLGENPIIDGDLALGEGTGAVMFYQLLKPVIYYYNNGLRFDDSKVEQYRRF